MREEIKNMLKDAKNLHATIINEYSNVLPKHIIEAANSNIQKDIPNRVNSFIQILNQIEKANVYAEVKSIDEAIEVLENDSIDVTIAKALENKNPIAISFQGGHMSHTLLTNIKETIKIGVDTLSLQAAAGRISR